MAESAESLFRRGMISGRAFNRVLAGTRPQNSKMANFDSKAGRHDQGGLHAHGAIDERHVEDMRNPNGMPKSLGGPPTKGGRAGKEGHNVRRNEIDDRAVQGPEFPRGAGRTSGRAQPGFVKTRPEDQDRRRAPAIRRPSGASSRRAGGQRDVLSSGGEYGGPNSQRNG